MWRRPLLGKHGRVVVAALCAWELAALYTPLPTISEVVSRRPWVGAVLMSLLAHHWFVEQPLPAEEEHR